MNKKCPLTGDPCWQYECEWYTHIIGTNPQTGKQLDQWGCAMSWIPLMLIETAKESRQTGAAIESFRNEMVKQNGQMAVMFHDAARRVNGQDKTRAD